MQTYNSIWIYLFTIFLFPLAADQLVIGSKRFTESYILGEILTQLAYQVDETSVTYKPGLGNTGIVFAALQEGAIDLYPEYTGTISQEILKLPPQQHVDLVTLRALLRPLGLGVDVPLGFNNTYALAMREDMARQLNISRLSDLSKHPGLKLGFSQEFLKRGDGWEGLKKAYQLPQQAAIGIDHSLSYEALANQQIDVTDIYSTDPKIEKYRLIILEDDTHFFPAYEAVLIYRLNVPERFPRTWKAFQLLANHISNEEMLTMNALAELEKESFESIAKRFLPYRAIDATQSIPKTSFLSHLFGPNLWRLTKQHLFLVFGSLLPAILIGIPLGILAAYCLPLRHLILNLVGIIQTIPSLALLAFLIPILKQIGTLPALIALFLYALLPIVRNTYTGLSNIPRALSESAIALGLPLLTRLVKIEIPLSSRTILAGIKTAAVVNVGMATIAALIGAGGFGERIIAGLAVNDYETLLAGAIPACALAILVQLGFDVLDYWLIPKGLK